ncbi:class I glutamine amidotransferase-like protein [Atractiella rhizophila]|nr:class I glutamine amidotransferase-like protein [Atractiella rhizophila]
MTKKILIVLTSHPHTDDSLGGWFLPELAHPYNVFKKAGYSLTFASPKGGEAPLDWFSIDFSKQQKDSESLEFLEKNEQVWKTTKVLSEFSGKSGEYDAIFYPGGHGPVFDLAVDETSKKLITEFWEAGKVVSAVCHGPAVFRNVVLSNGQDIVSEKKLTGYTNSEEAAIGATEKVPFLLEDALAAKGAVFSKVADYQPNVVVDGKFITGQNPASAGPVAEAIVKALS